MSNRMNMKPACGSSNQAFYNNQNSHTIRSGEMDEDTLCRSDKGISTTAQVILSRSRRHSMLVGVGKPIFVGHDLLLPDVK